MNEHEGLTRGFHKWHTKAPQMMRCWKKKSPSARES